MRLQAFFTVFIAVTVGTLINFTVAAPIGQATSTNNLDVEQVCWHEEFQFEQKKVTLTLLSSFFLFT